jgi:hypothetical protein
VRSGSRQPRRGAAVTVRLKKGDARAGSDTPRWRCASRTIERILQGKERRMADLDEIEQDLLVVESGLKGFLIRDWSYIAMLFFALLGVALTTVERSLMSFYWLILVPVFGLICIIESWRRLRNSDQRLVLVKVQALHWLSVIFAMTLVFTGDMKNALSNEVTALVLLIILSLGTLSASVHINSWRMGLVGLLLGLSVPGIALLEESTLLFVVIGLGVGALLLMFVKADRNVARA